MSIGPTATIVDSHTEGEPTRLVVEGGPELRGRTLPEKLEDFRRRFDDFRSAVVCEPRGSDAVVGALLCEPATPEARAGVIFFNNVGYLGMCGHGTIGLVATLAHLGRVGPGEITVETPVGPVQARLHPDGRVTVRNVRSYVYRKRVVVAVEGYGEIVGDVAFGGNWFFLVEDHGLGLRLANLDVLTRFSAAVRQGLQAQGITGADGAEIDHVELFGPPHRSDADSRNFVLCPGLAYDRSPCGTGLSAKLACLRADGKLREGEVWRQESIIGSLFEGSFVDDGDGIVPSITGRAYVTAQATLIFDPHDPFRHGIVA